MFKLTAILCVLAVGSPDNHLCLYGDVPLTDGIKLNNLETCEQTYQNIEEIIVPDFNKRGISVKFFCEKQGETI